MVIDSSAVIAIMFKEPERARLEAAIRSAPTRLISAPNLVEVSIVVLSRRGEEGLALLRELLADMRIEPTPLTPAHADISIDAFRRYGKGRHRAGLNFGDCFSYAVAKATGEPLLFKGDDFRHTDIERAL
jgi:ribonuclease VapC